jgi:hypothetical protein
LTDNTSIPDPAWLPVADELRLALYQLAPEDRRLILDFIRRPLEKPQVRKGYPIGECMAAARRVAELMSDNPKWTRARARKEIARELGITTTQLRYMLSHV